MSKIEPCLWFDNQAEAAAKFYVETFRACGQPASLGTISRYGKDMPLPEGTVLTASFSLAGQDFLALNGGPVYSFSPAISLMVSCADQAELDAFWDRLSSDGGKPVQCGWLTDKFGLSWQVVPAVLSQLMKPDQPERAARVMQAIMQMVKLDIATLQKAYDG
ncbi:MAG TPA: VOC family protein [Dongiaceae bacterium]